MSDIKIIFLHKNANICLGPSTTVLNYLVSKYNSLEYESIIH